VSAAGVIVRRAAPDDCDLIADMIRRLARDTVPTAAPKVTGEALRREAFGPTPLLGLWVAEMGGSVVGALVGCTVYSTWKAGRGLYVVDLYVANGHRGARVGERLVAAAAADARRDGAIFMKLEVAEGNAGAERFYGRLGFRPVTGDVNWVLDGDGFRTIADRR
jgi:ribosomal protein S18 acetylase RimI-like enzyme